jgi:hypothetical protein
MEVSFIYCGKVEVKMISKGECSKCRAKITYLKHSILCECGIKLKTKKRL